MAGLFNAFKALIALILISLGWYSLGYGFTSTNGDANFLFIGGFLIGGAGIAILIYIARNAKD